MLANLAVFCQIGMVDGALTPPTFCFYARNWTRTVIDQLVRVFLNVSVTLNGLNHIAHLHIQGRGCRPATVREAHPPGCASWLGAAAFVLNDISLLRSPKFATTARSRAVSKALLFFHERHRALDLRHPNRLAIAAITHCREPHDESACRTAEIHRRRDEGH